MSDYGTIEQLQKIAAAASLAAVGVNRIADHLDRCVCNHSHEHGAGSVCSAKLNGAQIKSNGGELRCQCPFHVPVLVALTQRSGAIREQVQATIGLMNVVAVASGVELRSKEESNKPKILTPRGDGRFA